LLIVHGNQREAKAELQREAEPYPNIQLFAVSDKSLSLLVLAVLGST